MPYWVLARFVWHKTDHLALCSDLLEVLDHLPRSAFDPNSFSLVRLIRDISSAYLAEIKAGSEETLEDDATRSKVLLERLKALDYRFITGIPRLNDHVL